VPNMSDSELLTMLKADLEIISANTTKDTYLGQLISAAKKFIGTEGITLDLSDMEDCTLVVMYAAWLYRKRTDPTAPMPRMLRWALNNRLFKEKVNE